jgi:RNA polymerase sigma-70 factor (ECF subfamily)
MAAHAGTEGVKAIPMSDLAAGSRRAGSVATRELEPQLEAHRVELTAHCYRMLGSAFDAEDAVQETMVRAWRSLDRFEGRSSLRSWLYRIATNVCLTMLDGRNRRARPMDLGPAGTATSPIGPALPEVTWLEPIPDGMVLASEGDPAELAVARETVRLAFVAALQHLPPRQRAVLILREVLQWSAAEVAELLDTTVASVNSALQRARATLAARDLSGSEAGQPVDKDHRDLLIRYADAFERYDLDSLIMLLHEDATLSMPPLALWLRGHDDIMQWWLGPGSGCRGSRLVPISASGWPAFGQYRPSGPGGWHDAWGVQVLEIDGRRITGFNTFLDTERLFPLFGLALRLDD